MFWDTVITREDTNTDDQDAKIKVRCHINLLYDGDFKKNE